jgi:hypothetical protein
MNTNEDEVREIIERLALVDLYLEWLGEPGAYHHIGDEQSDWFQAFEELRQRVRTQQFRGLPELQQRTIRNSCFAAIKESGEYMDIRQVFAAMRQRPEEVVNRVRPELSAELAERLDEPLGTPAADDSVADGERDDLLEQLASAEDGQTLPPGAQVLNLVDGPEHAQEVGPLLVQVAQELEDERREQRQRLGALRQVEKALRALQGVELDEDTPALDDIAGTLSEVIARAEALAADIEDLSPGD